MEYFTTPNFRQPLPKLPPSLPSGIVPAHPAVSPGHLLQLSTRLLPLKKQNLSPANRPPSAGHKPKKVLFLTQIHQYILYDNLFQGLQRTLHHKPAQLHACFHGVQRKPLRILLRPLQIHMVRIKRIHQARLILPCMVKPADLMLALGAHKRNYFDI